MTKVLPPNSPVPVVFDTSVLRSISVSRPSPELGQLTKLAKSGKVTLEMSEVVAREWLSQREKDGMEAIGDFAKAIRAISDQRSLSQRPDIAALIKSGLGGEASAAKLRATARDWHKQQIDALKIKTLPIEPDDAKASFDIYFEGSPPFRALKAREDLPDGFVLVALRRRKAQDDRTIFVCNDGRLAKAAEALGIYVAASLPDLLQSPVVARLYADATFATWWKTNFKPTVQSLKQTSNDLSKLIPNLVVDAVYSTTVSNPEIPDDNNEAWVASVGTVDDLRIEWDEAVSLGEGIISIPTTFTADLDLEFSVYRLDSFGVPDWVKVKMGDFETDHYFDAYGERVGRFCSRLVLTFASDVQLRGIKIDEAEVSIEDVEFVGLE